VRVNRSRSLYLLSPAPLIVVSWFFTIVGVMFGYAARNDLPVMVRTMELNGIDFDFPVAGMVWIGVCLLVVFVFGLASMRPISRDARAIESPEDLSRAVRIAAVGHAAIVLVVIAWVIAGAAQVGGFDRLIAMAAEQETYEARDIILANKLFPGMRLLYTGLISLGIFGACVFAANLKSPSRIRSDMRIGAAMFLASTVTLSILPIFLSQRILLVQMVLSTFVAVSMVAGRPFHLRYAAVLSALLFAVWSLREAVTVGPWASDYSAARIGGEKLAYYLVNDFYNAVKPFSTEIEHTFGFYSFNFLLYFSTVEDVIREAFADRISAVEQMRAGGVFPAFTAPYVDFSWMGVFFIVALVLFFTWVFNRAHRSFTLSVIYGQIGGALLLTPHVAWYTHHNFIFNVLLTLIVCAFIRRRTSTSAGWRHPLGPSGVPVERAAPLRHGWRRY
jgi:hypothetical protein